MVMDGDWHEERPTLIDSSGWALNPESYYLNYLNYYTTPWIGQGGNFQLTSLAKTESGW